MIAIDVPDREYLRADTPEEFAHRILEAISSAELASWIASNGRFVARRYCWKNVGKSVFKTLSSPE
jgi:hypothetical protein